MHNSVIHRVLQYWSACKSTLLFLKETSFTVYLLEPCPLDPHKEAEKKMSLTEIQEKSKI